MLECGLPTLWYRLGATPDRWKCLRWSQGGVCNRLPWARHVDSNPFGNGISRTSRYIVHEVAWDRPPLGGRRIEHDTRINGGETTQSA